MRRRCRRARCARRRAQRLRRARQQPALVRRRPWSYNPLTHQYTLKFHFDWFVDNVYHGYNIVERTLLLSNDLKAIAGPARATRYAANGTVLSAVCGSAVSTRL